MEPLAKKRRLAPKVEAQASPRSPHYVYEPPVTAVPVPVHVPPAPDVAPPPLPPERLEFESFARHLQDAAMLICRQAQKPPHAKVSVLTLRWERGGDGGGGEDAVTPEDDVLALEHLLRERYRYTTHRYSIPSAAGSRSSLKLGISIRSFLESQGPEHLLIMFYAGHSCLDANGDICWASTTGDDAIKIRWKGVRCLFEESSSDVLFLLDTHAAREDPIQSTSTGCQDVLACASIGSEVSQLPSAATLSFTAQLAEAFAKLADDNRLFTTEHLFHEIAMQRQHEFLHARSSLPNGMASKPEFSHDKLPLLYKLAAGRSESLMLGPMKSPDVPTYHQAVANPEVIDENTILPSGLMAGLTFEEQRVLVCTTYVGEASPNMSSFSNWLQHRFADLPYSASSAISVEGMFLGPPTMLLISMPMAVWNVVQHDKVCCFLGCVSSHNMTHLYERLVRSPVINLAVAKIVDHTTAQAPQAEAAVVSATTPINQRHDARRDTLQQAQPPLLETPIRLMNEHVDPRSKPRSESGRKPLYTIKALNRVGKSAGNDPEDSAEIKAAAEQLSALSHVRHLSDDGAEVEAVSSSPLLNYRDKRTFDNMSSPQDDLVLSGGARDMTPTKGKGQQRRSLTKQLLSRQDTQCEHCSHTPFKDTSALRKHIAAAHTRPFPCAFAFAGCPSTFGSKNEWKRHIASQHLCLTYYRCTACLPQHGNTNGTTTAAAAVVTVDASVAGSKGGNNISSNEFNRKDLFTQHLRRMHAPFAIKKALAKNDGKLQLEWESHVKEMQQSCLVIRRRPPQRSACPKPDCASVFEGPASWDEWTEHVGRHMEKGEAGAMGVDGLLAEWALAEGVIERRADVEGSGFRLVSGMGSASSPVVDSHNHGGGSRSHASNTARGSSNIGSSSSRKIAEQTNHVNFPPPPPPPPAPTHDRVITKQQENHTEPPKHDTTTTTKNNDSDDRTIVAASTILSAAMAVDV